MGVVAAVEAENISRLTRNIPVLHNMVVRTLHLVGTGRWHTTAQENTEVSTPQNHQLWWSEVVSIATAIPRRIEQGHHCIRRLHQPHRGEHTFTMITHLHLHRLGMEVVAVEEDHTGIQGNHLIHQPIHLLLGDQVGGINLTHHRRIPILFTVHLRIMLVLPHQIIRIRHHQLTTADQKITMLPCTVEILRFMERTITEEDLIRPCRDLTIRVCQCLPLI
mmetsp:Transcript_24961/g.68825  ORF Transcript_24961/g.68825 Transcript_24961/m.68825 type:complete len:220 (+) Transcript_24961:1687-2346(+)